jgi:hypothetical protein
MDNFQLIFLLEITAFIFSRLILFLLSIVFQSCPPIMAAAASVSQARKLTASGLKGRRW